MPCELKISCYNFAFTDQTDGITVAQPTPTRTPAKPSVNALDFLRSRPQVAAMNQVRSALPQKRASSSAPALPSKVAKAQISDPEPSDPKKSILPAHDLGTF